MFDVTNTGMYKGLITAGRYNISIQGDVQNMYMTPDFIVLFVCNTK